jgi:polyisoprenoid-binding protein YceI
MTTATAIATTPLTGTWAVDPTHSSVEFSVKHLGIATVKGAFREFEGALVIGEGLASATATGTVKVASVDTNEPQRDEHLRSADFFDAATYPELTFASTAIRPVDDDVFEIDAGMTMHGVTKPITLTAEVQGFEQDPWGNERVGLELRGQLSRGEFGMTFNQALGSGNMLVSDKVKLSLDISAVKQA